MTDAHRPSGQVLEVVYRWPEGREEVRYRRPADSTEAHNFVSRIERLKAEFPDDCPYSYRYVP
jgi:hypothetical protein